MSFRLKGSASPTNSGSSSDVKVIPPLARALPSLLTAMRLREQADETAMIDPAIRTARRVRVNSRLVRMEAVSFSRDRRSNVVGGAAAAFTTQIDEVDLQLGAPRHASVHNDVNIHRDHQSVASFEAPHKGRSFDEKGRAPNKLAGLVDRRTCLPVQPQLPLEETCALFARTQLEHLDAPPGVQNRAFPTEKVVGGRDLDLRHVAGLALGRQIARDHFLPDDVVAGEVKCLISDLARAGNAPHSA